MRLLRILVMALLTTAVSALSVLSLTSSAQAYTWVGTLSPEKAEVRLDHTDLISIYNDPFAAGRQCQALIGDTYDNRIATPVNYVNCAGDLQSCTEYAVIGGRDYIYVVWTVSGYQCSYSLV